MDPSMELCSALGGALLVLVLCLRYPTCHHSVGQFVVTRISLFELSRSVYVQTLMVYPNPLPKLVPLVAQVPALTDALLRVSEA